MMEFELTPGQIQVSENGVQQIIDHDDVKVFEIDLISKYPGLIMEWSTSGKMGADFYASEDTLSAAQTDHPTTFSLPLDSRQWIMMASGARYTIRVIAYRRRH